MARARSAAGDGAPALVKLRHYFDHPGFIAANAEHVRSALETVPPGARLVFTAHSIPVTMNDSSGPERNGLYLKQHLETARLVTEEVQGPGTASDLVFQSRSGPPHVAWLGPDINEHLESLAAHRVPGVVVCPTGFVSDHVEVIWDLDTEARATAQRLGLPFARAATAGTHPAFVAAIRELVQEQSAGLPPRRLGNLGLCGVDCPQGCCPASERPSA
jgi:ferrochelatase